MATITEDYCSQDVYRLLREKGFDGEIHTTFDKEGYTQASITLQMIRNWLEEVHNLFIQITVDFSDGAYPMYDVYVVNLATCTSIAVNGYDRYSSKDACKTAIKYCLKNLI
jgi:hypothetical protein